FFLAKEENAVKFNLYGDIKSFCRDTRDVLMRHEAQNLIPLGNVIIGYEEKDKTGWRDPALWFMATVTDNTGIRMTAIMTPPHNLTLYATDNVISSEAVDCLISGIMENKTAVPGVMTENVLAENFAKAWAAANSVNYSVKENMRIYELVSVNPEIPQIGKMRLLDEKDLSFFPYWIDGFNHDCFGDAPVPKPDLQIYQYHVNKKKIYILENEGTAVSMAQKNREMQSVCGVSMVYTPPYFRGKGYASSLVAGLSRLILDQGFTKCVLYTDLSNPISNSIYQKIGYRPICDSLVISFEGMDQYNKE
ncbi:MAG: GNAT family N-acetyltransferase, partial [Treponema sp.]|nr:GNAT family N-acetyltransferase [Treponema sp.]